MATPALTQAAHPVWVAPLHALRRIRVVLDPFYRLCGLLSGAFLAGIALTVIAQVGARMFSVTIDSTESAGFCMAASAFFGLAYAMRNGDHIRVSLLLQHLPARVRKVAEIWCCGTGAVGMTYFTCHAANLAWESFSFGDRSPGLIAMPFWIPQLSMVLGAAALAVALFDDLFAVASGRKPAYAAGEEGSPSDTDVSGGHSGVG
jgi:TRAP-type C4-dicarboxylate transport system permease small subunit